MSHTILRFKLLYFILFCGYGALGPYYSLFFLSLNFPESQIGLLSMLPNVCSFLVAPFSGFVGDKYNVHREVLVISLILSTCTTTAMMYVYTFASQFMVCLLTAIFRAPIGPQVDAVVMSCLEDKAVYGSLRLWGAVSFGIFAFIGGILTSSPTPSSSSTTGSSTGTHHISTTTSGGGTANFTSVFFIYAFSSVIAGFIVLSFLYEEVMGHGRARKFKLDESTTDDSGDYEPPSLSTADPASSAQYEVVAATVHTSLLQNVDTTHKQHQQEEENRSATTLLVHVDDDDIDDSDDSDGNDETSPASQLVPKEKRPRMKKRINSSSGGQRHNAVHSNTRIDTKQSLPVSVAKPHNDDARVVDSLFRLFQRKPEVLVFGVVVFLSGVGAGVIDSYLFLRLKELGGAGLVMGLARFITCAAEIPMFQMAGPLQARYGTWPMIALTQAAFVVRFVYYSLLRDPWAVLPCEALNGLTFAVTWSVSCTYANEIAPLGCEGVMQALLEGLHFGIGCGMGALLGGFAYEQYGAVRLFEWSGLLSCISTVLALSTWWWLSTTAAVTAGATAGTTDTTRQRCYDTATTSTTGSSISTCTVDDGQFDAETAAAAIRTSTGGAGSGTSPNGLGKYTELTQIDTV